MAFTYRWGAGTDVGRVRAVNQDCLAPTEPGSGAPPLLFAVADGLGGLEAGEIASRLAIEAATAAPITDSAVTLTDRVNAAHDAVVEYVLGSPDVIESATTLTLAAVHPDGTLDIAHVGDSRLYVASAAEMVQVTVDQTVAQRKVEAGLIAPEAADDDPDSHILTSACGLEIMTIQNFSGIELRPGERVLMCSDGLTGMVGDERILQILAANADPQRATIELIAAANAAGGNDNITVLVVDVGAAH